MIVVKNAAWTGVYYVVQVKRSPIKGSRKGNFHSSDSNHQNNVDNLNSLFNNILNWLIKLNILRRKIWLPRSSPITCMVGIHIAMKKKRGEGGKWVYESPKDCLSLPVSKLDIWESRVAKSHAQVTSEASLIQAFRYSGECRVSREKKKDKQRERSPTLPTPTHIVLFVSCLLLFAPFRLSGRLL